MRSFRSSSRGFSLIELGVVVAVIGVLAAIAIPTFLGQREAAQDKVAISALRNAASTARTETGDDGQYPALSTIETNEPAFDFTEDASEGPNQISSAVFPTNVTFAALADSGTCWVLTSPLDGGTDWEGVDLAEGEECRAGQTGLGEIVLSAVLIQPDGSQEVSWEPDPEAVEYEVCDSGTCTTTTSTSHTFSTSDTSIRSIRSDGSPSGYTTTSSSGSSSGGDSGSEEEETVPPAPDESEPLSVELNGEIVALSWTDSSDAAESYDIRRCSTAGCTSGFLVGTVTADGSETYDHEDDVSSLIDAEAEVARYQVVSTAGVYQVASNWAEVALPTATASYEDLVLASNPLVFWQFDETSTTPAAALDMNGGPNNTVMADSSGNGFDGWYYGYPDLDASPLTAGDGSGVGFDGSQNATTDEYVIEDPETGEPVLVENVVPTPDLSSGATFEAWVDLDATDAEMILDRADDGGSPVLEFGVFTQPLFIAAGSGGSVELFGNTSLPTGQTYHLVVTVDDTEARLYVNGLLDATTNHSVTDFSPTTSEVSIGTSFNGVLDDLAIYDTALTSSEVVDHYNAGTGS